MNSAYRTDRDPALEPGEVVWANVLNPHENRHCHGKPRPAILLSRQRGSWQVMGLTTNPAFADGTPRTAVKNPTALGLPGPSYLWGRPTTISAIDVRDHIGWVDRPTALRLVAYPEILTTAENLLGEAGPQWSDAA